MTKKILTLFYISLRRIILEHRKIIRPDGRKPQASSSISAAGNVEYETLRNITYGSNYPERLQKISRNLQENICVVVSLN